MLKKYLNKFLNKKSDFTEDEKLRTLNEQFYFILGEERRLLNFLISENIRYYFTHKKVYLTKLLFINLIRLGAISGIIFGIFFSLNYFSLLSVTIPTKKVAPIIIYKNDSTMNLKNYLIQIAYGESRYVVKAQRDGSQYLGIFQIGRNERKITGYGDISDQVFLAHEDIQILVMIKLLKLNKKTMQPYIDKYSGKIVDGILVTESGILALCQLGTGSAQEYLDSGTIPVQDSSGNKPRELLKMGGYKLNLDKIDVVSVVKNINQ